MRILRRGKVLLWVVALILVGAMGGFLLAQQARRFSAIFAKAEADKTTLMKTRQELQTQFGLLQDEVAKLTQAQQSLTSDRDNLLAQVKRLSQEKEDFATVTDLHERVLKRTDEENRALKGKLEPLEREHEELVRTHQELLDERDAIQRELEEAQQRTKEHQLKRELAKQQQRHEEDAAALRQTKIRIKELEAGQAKAQTELPKLQGRLGALQEKYSTLLLENKTLKFRSKNVPKDVTSLAREHERLLQDLADTHYNMGVLFVKNEDYVRAAKEFQKVVELKPQDADAHYNLGLIYAEHLSDRDKATACFHKYLQISPHAKDASWVKQYIVSWKAWEAKDNLE